MTIRPSLRDPTQMFLVTCYYCKKTSIHNSFWARSEAVINGGKTRCADCYYEQEKPFSCLNCGKKSAEEFWPDDLCEDCGGMGDNLMDALQSFVEEGHPDTENTGVAMEVLLPGQTQSFGPDDKKNSH